METTRTCLNCGAPSPLAQNGVVTCRFCGVQVQAAPVPVVRPTVSRPTVVPVRRTPKYLPAPDRDDESILGTLVKGLLTLATIGGVGAGLCFAALMFLAWVSQG